MLTDADRRVLQEHTAKVEAHDRKLARVRSDAIVSEPRDEHGGSSHISEAGEKALAAFHAAHPAPQPYATLTSIRYLIDYLVDAQLEGRRWAQARIAAKIPGWSDSDKQAFFESEARKAYAQVREEILLLQQIAPSIARDELLREANDPIVGIQNLRAWCLDAMRPVDTVQQDPLATVGVWSNPMRKKELAARIKLTLKKFNAWAKGYGLKKHTRELYSIRIDNMDPKTRACFE